MIVRVAGIAFCVGLLAGFFGIGGGIVGGWIGMKLACHLAAQRSTLNRVFAALIFVVAGYIVWRSARQA